MAKPPSYIVPNFNPITHMYSVKGVNVPGFSQIAQDMGLIDYSGIKPETLEWAKWKGTVVHLGCDLIDRGTLDWSTVADEIRGYLEAYRKFKGEFGFMETKIELPLFHPIYRYACKVDRIGGRINDKNKPYVLEIKTTATEMSSHILQVIAQSLCLNPLRLPYLLYLRSNGTYKLRPVKEIEFSEYKNIWLSAVTLYHYKKEQRGTNGNAIN